MKIKYKTAFFLFFFVLSTLTAQKLQLDVIPYPKKIEVLSGQIVNWPQSISACLSAVDTSGMMINIIQLNQLFQNKSAYRGSSGRKERYVIRLGIPQQGSDFDQLCQEMDILPDESLGNEGYVLWFGSDKSIVAANGKAGVFYGVQTLLQLLRSLNSQQKISAMKITDWPDFAFRGIHDDISRGPVPTLEYMKEQIRRFAELKLNVLSYYTEHIVETKSHGDFAPARGAVSIDEWKELDNYARKHFIQLIGNFQSFAHFEKILAFPQYENLGDTERLLSPLNPKSFEFLQNIYREMAPAFHAPYFMVGGDETWDLGRGKSKKYVDSLGFAHVYANHMKRIGSELNKYNKRMIMWADMALQHPGILKMLPRKTILATWNYSVPDSFNDFIMPLKSAGFDILVCPGILNSRRMMPDYSVTIPNIKQFIKDGYKQEVMGVLNTVWDNGGEALFSRDWYGAAYGAEQSWHVNDISLENYNGRFDLVIYGDKQQKISETISHLTKLADLALTQDMNLPVFWRWTIPEQGKTVFINRADWLEVQNIADCAETILLKSKAKTFPDDIKALQLTVDQYQYMASSRLLALAAADHYKEACLRQKSDREQANELLRKVREELHQIHNKLTNLKKAVKETWQRENRIYWLDHILNKYDEKIANLSQVRQYLQKAVDDFELGYFLPSPIEIGLEIKVITGQYFQNWLLCGSFPNIQDAGREIDFLQNMGGETDGIPESVLVFEGLDGKKTGWQKYSSPKSAEIDLTSVYENNKEVVAYAYCLIESPEKMNVQATLGSNDGIQLFINGQKLFSRKIKRSLVIDEEDISIPLEKGENHILLKIDQNKGEWGFSFRLPDLEVRNHKHKYRIIK